jgi:hypothetical protein
VLLHLKDVGADLTQSLQRGLDDLPVGDRPQQEHDHCADRAQVADRKELDKRQRTDESDKPHTHIGGR